MIHLISRTSRLALLLAVLPILCGLISVIYGRVLVAKILFEQVDSCFLHSANMTVRLYLSSFGATTAYTELVTVQEGWLPHEQIFFSSYGYPLVEALDCYDSEVRLTGDSTFTFSVDQIRKHTVSHPIVLDWGKRVEEDEIMTWDPVRILCGLPLLFVGAVVILLAMARAIRMSRRANGSNSADVDPDSF